jgi:ribose 5-phosphate isomerase
MTNHPQDKSKQHAAAQAGIVGHGLFLNLANDVIVAGPAGIRHLEPASP